MHSSHYILNIYDCMLKLLYEFFMCYADVVDFFVKQWYYEVCSH